MTANDYLLDVSKGKSVYDFTGSELVTSYSNSPKYSMIKNDYVVWGIRTTSDDTTVPIRYHLAIDTKPEAGNEYNVFFYKDEDDGLTKASAGNCYEHKSDFPETGVAGGFYYSIKDRDSTVYTWNQDPTDKEYKYIATEYKFKTIKTTDWRTELYLQGVMSD
jgi:hypothetical protein